MCASSVTLVYPSASKHAITKLKPVVFWCNVCLVYCFGLSECQQAHNYHDQTTAWQNYCCVSNDNNIYILGIYLVFLGESTLQKKMGNQGHSQIE